MIELLATTFDTELQDKEQDLDHAVGLLSNIEKEYLEGQRKILNYERMLSDFGQKKLALGDLENELNDKLGKRYRFGWEKYVRDEEERARRITEQRLKYLQELSIEDRKLLDSSNLRFADPSKQEVLMKLQADERENSDLLNLIRTNSTDVESECDWESKLDLRFPNNRGGLEFRGKKIGDLDVPGRSAEGPQDVLDVWESILQFLGVD
ncbi:hypothetical protein PGTUg99_006483 [Puccinia graminis f. sp. tritici]|uniref:Uncharacterized protein n=1 Tax=Puccinia graminis f. sp. tritici TaxID=56615 RepID=A0A5B0NAG0_PUCGR|nr:hypothetical protein PGTUg99_006483 [Puccinia graminis f. sp. tritici]